MDNVGIVFEDLERAVAFFVELGLELEGTARVEGEVAEKCVGLADAACDIAMLRVPGGAGRLELARYVRPGVHPATPAMPPHNTVGMHRVMFAVDELDDVLARLRPHGAELVGEVAQYGDSYRLCYVRGPEGIIVGLAEQLG
nr:VOC family protein [Kribbella sandramycini]